MGIWNANHSDDTPISQHMAEHFALPLRRAREGKALSNLCKSFFPAQRNTIRAGKRKQYKLDGGLALLASPHSMNSKRGAFQDVCTTEILTNETQVCRLCSPTCSRVRHGLGLQNHADLAFCDMSPLNLLPPDTLQGMSRARR